MAVIALGLHGDFGFKADREHGFICEFEYYLGAILGIFVDSPIANNLASKFFAFDHEALPIWRL